MRATIITIGDEILIGQIVDTNSASISRKLNAIGITIGEKISIADSREAIVTTVTRAMSESQVVVITGGLGPTKDDITKTTLAEMFNSKLRYDDKEGEHIRQLLARRNIAFTELNRSQALVPECCTVLHNAYGTAPGMWFDTAQGGVVVSLPGVPFEMEHLMDDIVVARLAERFALRSIVHRTLITRGIAESILAERIAAWEESLPRYMHLAYLPAPNIVRLRLSAYDVDRREATQAIDSEFNKLYAIIGDNILGYEDESIEHLIHEQLSKRGLSLAIAESCTGGAIASKFTAMAGASKYFLAGVVSYSNEAKRDILGVRMEDIERYGAVSEEVARQMAEGVRRVSGADYAIATTGIAGPTGGSEAKPVGTVWMAIATPTATYAQMRNSGNDRGQIISRATAYALEMLYEELKKLF
ncbi:MAG: competence/damage-inducible protein A [Rikenellaceae bacterium]|nr:competence/damage-inducible protein A [Rikenellaceae bacterium]